MGGARQILLTATVLLVCHRGLWAQSRIEWVGSWAEAQALAARHQRLVLIHFWSPDCAPCRKLERSVFNQPECIRAMATNYVAWKVNVAENPDRGTRLCAWSGGRPTSILAATGQELYRGPSPAEPTATSPRWTRSPPTPGSACPPASAPAPMWHCASAPAQHHRRLGLPARARLPDQAYPPASATNRPSATQPGRLSTTTAQTASRRSAAIDPTAVGYRLSTADRYRPSTVYGPPPANPTDNYWSVARPTVRPRRRPQRRSQAPLSPAYVTNQWVVPERHGRTATDCRTARVLHRALRWRIPAAGRRRAQCSAE